MDKFLEPVIAPLRPTLLPYTNSLPAPLVELGTSLLGASCYKTLVEQLSPQTECLSLAFSKALGLAIVFASSIVKLPQLLKILSARSGAGLSFLSVALETSALVVAAAYNFRVGYPFSTYGEGVLIAVQNAAIGAAVLAFGGLGDMKNGGSGAQAAAATWTAVLAATAAALTRPEVVPMSIMSQLMAGAGVVGVASKLPQIWTIWQEGGTGQLSSFAVFNYLLGSLARIYTTLKEVDDPLILYAFVAGFALNAVLAAQMVYYWNSPATAKSESLEKQAKQVKGDAARVLKDQSASMGEALNTGAQKIKSPSTRRRG